MDFWNRLRKDTDAPLVLGLLWTGLFFEGVWLLLAFAVAGVDRFLIELSFCWAVVLLSTFLYLSSPWITATCAWLEFILCAYIVSGEWPSVVGWKNFVYRHSADIAIAVVATCGALRKVTRTSATS